MMKHKARCSLVRSGGLNLWRSHRRRQWGLALLVLHWGALYAESPSVAVGNISPTQNADTWQSIDPNSASSDNQRIAHKQEDVWSREELKNAIITKNIFRPSKPITHLTFEENVTFGLGPEPLRNSFTLLGIRETEQGMSAYLSFINPTPRVEEVAVGHVIEDVVTIIAIKQTFIRCKISGLDVRISVNESSTDAWMRLSSSNMINYILLGTVETDTGYLAHIKVIGEDAYRTIEVGDMLGDATVIIIEEGHVLLIDSDGNEISIRAPLFSP